MGCPTLNGKKIIKLKMKSKVRKIHESKKSFSMPELTPSANTSVNQLSQYIERIERLEEEKRHLWQT